MSDQFDEKTIETGEANHLPEQEKESLTIRENLTILFGASKAFWLVNLVNFGDGIAYFGILNLLTLYISRDIGFSDQATGMAVSFFTGAVTLFMFGGGFISDWIGVRKSLTLCMVGLLVGRILLTISPGFGGVLTDTSLWVALFVMAAATGVLQPTLYAGVKEFTDPRTATIGYAFLYAIMNLGIAAGSFASPFIRGSFGISGVYWVLTALTFIMLFLNLMLFTKKREKEDRYLEYVKDETPLGETKSLAQKVKELPFLDPRFIFFIFILLPVRTLFAHQWLTIPDYILRC